MIASEMKKNTIFQNKTTRRLYEIFEYGKQNLTKGESGSRHC